MMTPDEAKRTIKTQRRMFRAVHPSRFRDPFIEEECAHGKQLLREAKLALAKRYRKPTSTTTNG